MLSAASVPASEGAIRAVLGPNGNTEVTLKVKHLATPSRVAEDASVYVVWIQPSDAAQQNVGALILNDNLEGKLETVTPYRQFLVSVTPESSSQVTVPTHEPVFTFYVERPNL